MLPVWVPLNPPGPCIKLPTLGFKYNAIYFRVNVNAVFFPNPAVVCTWNVPSRPNTFPSRTKQKQASPITVVPRQQYLRTEVNNEKKKKWRCQPVSKILLFQMQICILVAATALLRPYLCLWGFYRPNTKSQHKFQQKIALAKNCTNKYIFSCFQMLPKPHERGSAEQCVNVDGRLELIWDIYLGYGLCRFLFLLFVAHNVQVFTMEWEMCAQQTTVAMNYSLKKEKKKTSP